MAMETLKETMSPSVVARTLRKVVSKDRHRFVDFEYDLDLSYITKNLIAMGFPSSGVEKLWRNSIDDIASMLNKYHPNHYMIWNLSDRRYNYEKFNNQILDFGFPDHHSPPLEMLFKIVLSMHSYLSQHPDNVAVVHCMGGKGRTGTVIACYLLYSGVCKDVMEALNLFASKRSSISKGVIQASQLRYSKYFGSIISREVKPDFRKRLYLKALEMTPTPRFGDIKTGIKPVVQVFSTHHYPKRLLYTTETDKQSLKYFSSDKSLFELNCSLQSDILIMICKYIEGKKKPKKMFRFSFHCAFVEEGELCIGPDELDANKNKKIKWFPKNWVMKLTFAAASKEPSKSDDRQYVYDDEVNHYLNTIKNETVDQVSEEVMDAVKNSFEIAPAKSQTPQPATQHFRAQQEDVRELEKLLRNLSEEKSVREEKRSPQSQIRSRPVSQIGSPGSQRRESLLIGASRVTPVDENRMNDAFGRLNQSPGGSYRGSLPIDMPSSHSRSNTRTNSDPHQSNNSSLNRNGSESSSSSTSSTSSHPTTTSQHREFTFKITPSTEEELADYDFLEEFLDRFVETDKEKMKRLEEEQLKQQQQRNH